MRQQDGEGGADVSHARPVYDPAAITHRRTRDNEERTEESGEQEGVRSEEDEVEP